MIRSIFTRDKPGTSDPAVAEALADAELKFGDTIPTGTYLDMTANLPVVDPARVKAPVLLVRGEHDGDRDDGGPARLLSAAAERRPPVRRPARHRTFARAQPQASLPLARRTRVPHAADRLLGDHS